MVDVGVGRRDGEVGVDGGDEGAVGVGRGGGEMG